VSDLKSLGAEVVMADYTDDESTKKAMEGVDVVWVTGPNTLDRDDLVIRVVKVAKSVKSVKHIVLLSVYGAEYEAILFGKQFRKVEKEIEASGISWTFLRATAFQENVFGSAGTIKNGMYYQPLGDKGSYAPVAISDLGKAAANVIRDWDMHKNKAYAITGPQVLTGAQQAEIVSMAIGKPVKYVDPGNDQFLTSAIAMGWPKWQAEGLLEMYNIFKTMPSTVSHDLHKLLGQEKPQTLYQTVFSGAAVFTKYKLTYFNLNGRAEAIRLAFAVGGIDFEDERIEQKDWPALKPKTPLGTMPILDVDGKLICESNSVLRFVGQLAGIYPSDPWISAKTDEIADACEDLANNPGLFPVLFSAIAPEEKKAKFEAALKPGGFIHTWGTSVNKILHTNGKALKFTVSDELTIGDLKLFALVTSAETGFPGLSTFREQFDKIKAVVGNVAAHPKIAAYYKKK